MTQAMQRYIQGCQPGTSLAQTVATQQETILCRQGKRRAEPTTDQKNQHLSQPKIGEVSRAVLEADYRRIDNRPRADAPEHRVVVRLELHQRQ